MESFVLVYADYEGFSILDIGNEEEIEKSYVDYCLEIDEFVQEYGEEYHGTFVEDFESYDKYQEYLEKMFSYRVHNTRDKRRLCIMSKVDGKVICVCKKFKETMKKTMFY